MKNKRIYQVAKEYNISSEALVSILRELKFPVKSHMSAIDEKMLSAIEEKFKQEKEQVKKEIEEKKRKLEERERKEATTVSEPSTEDIETREQRLRKKEELQKLEKKRLELRRRKDKYFKTKPEKTIDKKEIEESVKKTLALLEPIKKIKKTRKETLEPIEVQIAPAKTIKTTEFISVAELANLLGVRPAEVISKCISLGVMASINQRLDMDTIEAIALEFGYAVEKTEEIGLEKEEKEEAESLLPRPPVVTIMGHVDHGKTSLLDYIRKSNVIAGEFGGITQHIGAYEVELPNGKITFLDTPGHQAFTAMRARGVQVTDIVVLVGAADDAVMPQTVEAIDHARAANVPIIVAINKIDLPTANVDLIKNQLSKLNLVPEEWGGKTITVEVSAKTGKNIDKLLEMILLQAELLELKANPYRNAVGAIIDAELDRGKGPVATVLVQKGILKIGDHFVTGIYSGRVRAMLNERGKPVREAGPSTPVQVLGTSGVPQAGDTFAVVSSDQEAKEIAAKRLRLRRERDLRQMAKAISLTNVHEQIEEGQVKELKLIIKGDVDGSVEVLSDTLGKISTSQVKVTVLHQGVGSINESDVLLASASQAIVIGFHVRPDSRARELAEQEKVDIRLYNIIYDVESDIKKALEGLLEPETQETVTATVEVRNIFRVSKVGVVAGCYVQSGTLKRTDKVKIIRDGTVAYEGTISSLKRFKDDVREVSAGFECGLRIENYNDVKIGDILEAYEVVKLTRKLEQV